ncbi:HS12A-like protein [Mya arenaria]|uniref:HS12A-like protein n=1 Tax=Mya arenaria TaxID=6604 RepID=A0ABY7FY22_MYAAR|nr:HS12A-like protein [Mya arenaria]
MKIIQLLKQAGISSDKLIIALEPEAAAIYCRFLPMEISGQGGSLSTLETGSKVLVVDAGGGTVDIAVQEVAGSGSMKNIYKASGGDWGGTKVDDAYVTFVADIIGKDTIEEFKRSHMDDYVYMIRDFEMKKRGFDPLKINKSVIFRISATLPHIVKESKGKEIHDLITDSPFKSTVSITADKLRVDKNVVKNLIENQADAIVDHVSSTLNVPLEGRGTNRTIKARLIYGGTEIDVEATEVATGKAPLLVAAIDFGTTYAGWSYSFKHDFVIDPTKVATKGWHGDQFVSLKSGTVDIAVQEVAENGSMKNIYKASGGDWGGTKVDDAYMKFLEDMLGKETIEEFKRSNMDDYMFMIREFELKKRTVDPVKSVKPMIFRIPFGLLVKNIRGKKIHEVIKDSPFDSTVSIKDDKMKVNVSVVTNFFKTQVDAIVEHVSNLIDQSIIGDIAAVVLVGGFTGQCLNVQKAQVEKNYLPFNSNQIAIRFPIYYTLDPDPMYVTDEGCHIADELEVPIEGSGLARSVNVRMIYGGTEIEVEATEVATEKVHRLRIDFLS